VEIEDFAAQRKELNKQLENTLTGKQSLEEMI